MIAQPLHNARSIAGYELKERIGAGGYGEVWKAEAPGGLSKAIKFVYGYLDEVRAAGELKALNRIKGVRHPFLLSLERIEIVDGQLVIVTELADGCLKDRFVQCRKEDRPGVPRDELLVYLGDAADALDYMNANHSLQHLDVKPENLLLVGGRVKVGDFGLVKDIQDYTISLMGGLTPVYAPPEVFDGKPGHFSDQYSLAIVYQELLTGTLPFPGKTAAQLAAQHLNSRPRLTTLPEHDQPIIGRALSKDPRERFACCREMLDRLMEAGRARTSRKVAKAEPAAEPTADTKTQAAQKTQPPRKAPKSADGAVGEDEYAAPMAPSGTMIEAPVEPVSVSDLPPLAISPAEARLRPTLLVGMGGLTATVLRGLRRRLCSRFGGLEGLPALRMLLLDTDRKALLRATQGNEPLHSEETLALPLRRTQEYRRESAQLLKWLSRRWLYNIPRSLETEGLRPLGRLAFVDHADEVQKLLTRLLAEITDAKAATATSQTVGQPLHQGAPRVVLVASLMGGTGSGMVLDAAYTAQAALRELGFSEHAVTGVLLHGTPRSANARDLALINTFAGLSELHHFSQPPGYPGDEACGLPTSSQAPFTNTYLVHLGDDLTDEDLHRSLDGVVEYVYRDTVTAGAALLEKCRTDAAGEEQPSGTSLRSFGICRVGCAGTELADIAAELLCRAVIDRWNGEATTLRKHCLLESPPVGARGGASPMIDSREVVHLATQCSEALELNAQNLAMRIDELLDAALGKSANTCFAGLVQQFQAKRQLQQAQDEDLPAEEFVRSLDRVLGAHFGAEGGPSPSSACEGATGRGADVLAEKRGTAVADWLFQLADMPTGGAQAAQCAADWFVQHLKSLDRSVRESAQEICQQLTRLEQAWAAENDKEHAARPALGRGRKADAETEEQLLGYAVLRGRELSLRCLLRLITGMLRHVGAAGDMLRDVRRELSLLADQFPPPEPVSGEWQGPLETVQRKVAESLQARMEELATELAKSFLPQFLGDNGGLRQLISQPDFRSSLPTALRRAARAAIQAALRRVDVSDALLEPSADDQPSALQECVKAAQSPWLAQCGGARRLLLFLPEATEAERLTTALQEHGQAASSVSSADDGDLVFCCEARDIPPDRVADCLTQQRPGLADIAARVRTRLDVTWKPLQ